MTKITKEFSNVLPIGKYICRECLRKRRELQEKIRFENRQKSKLRDFRNDPNYIPLEKNSHLREKVTTDEELDQFIIDLETNTNDKFEFDFIERLVKEAIRLEFFQRKKASSEKSEKESPKESSNKELEYAYKILDLPLDAKFETVKTKYRELVKEYHPDKNPNQHKNWCDEMMKQINIAYEVIEKYFEENSD